MPGARNSTFLIAAALVAAMVMGGGPPAPGTFAQPLPPELTAPVNDFARVLDQSSAAVLDQRIRGLLKASGDVIVVATVDTVAPYGDIREYAVKMFENRGRGIGGAKQDAGVLVLLAVKDRQVRIETGYGLEEFITDGFAGETSRRMAPYFREGRYGEGLVAGVDRVARRIEEARGITPATPAPAEPEQRRSDRSGGSLPGSLIMLVVFVGLPTMFALLNAATRSRRRRRYPWWAAGPWSGWNSGVGPFGRGRGGFGGGFGGFGGGGGFGGFGGGMSGGGGGGASW
jgi:uncharacterized protein